MAVGLVAVSAGPAAASFPGRNGAIAYALRGDSKYGDMWSGLRAVVPRTRQVSALHDCPQSYPGPNCSVRGPHYSPDGRRLAFPMATSRFQPNGAEEFQPALGFAAVDGSGEEVVATKHPYGGLAWSPTGGQLLLERSFQSPPGRAAGMFVTSLAGNELAPVAAGFATGPTSPQPDWSSTGRIAFVRAPSGCAFPCPENIFLTRVGGSVRRLTYRGGSQPSWSPYASKLAFTRRRADPSYLERSDIYIVRVNGRGLRRFTHRGGHSPTWSPDGKWIAFIREDDLYIARTDGTRLLRLVQGVGAHASSTGRFVEAPDWQPLPRD